jgi:hypothetical protein
MSAGFVTLIHKQDAGQKTAASAISHNSLAPKALTDENLYDPNSGYRSDPSPVGDLTTELGALLSIPF